MNAPTKQPRAGTPCHACPWVPGRPLSDGIEDVHREAARRGDWFCCHVHMGTCYGAENFGRRERAKPEESSNV